MYEVGTTGGSEESPECSQLPVFTKNAMSESRRWIECLTGDGFKYPSNFIKSLQDGVLLCRLVNALKPGCIRRVNQMQTAVAFLDNLSVFQTSCKEEFGLQEAQLFDIRDLDDLDIRGTLGSEEEINKETSKRIKNILVTLYWLGKVSRSLRPDAALSFELFEGLVDPAPERQISSPCGSEISSRRMEAPEKFAEWKVKRMKQLSEPTCRIHEAVSSVDSDEKNDRSPVSVLQPTEIISKDPKLRSDNDEDDDDEEEEEEEIPEPPNWKTYPGGQGILYLGDLKFLDEVDDPQDSIPYPDTSSSSSASSFATKEFSDQTKTYEGASRVTQFFSPTSVLAASPETLTYDEATKNFDRLLKDVESLTSVTKSQSLQFLEDFDEVGFEGDARPREVDLETELLLCSRSPSLKNGNVDQKIEKKPPSKSQTAGRKGSDFLEELMGLEEATKKYDAHQLQSPDKLSSADCSSAVSPEVPSLASSVHLGVNGSSPAPSHKFQFASLDQFPQDLDPETKVESSNKNKRSFNLEGERKKMEEWNKKLEEELKDKFEKDQITLKNILKEDLKKAHQTERMKQLQEDKFLEEEEVMEQKNKKTFAEERMSKFSKSSLSLFTSLPFGDAIRGRSPQLPAEVESATYDWLCRSFSGDERRPGVESATSDSFVQREESPAQSDRERLEEGFEEPRWMVFAAADKVDRVVVDVPVNKATIEMLPSSLSSSSESLVSVSPDDLQENICTEDASGSKQDDFAIKSQLAVNIHETPPIPERNDSLLVASDILTSRQQATYLSFDASIANFAKSSSSSQPPNSLHLTPNPLSTTTTISSEGLLTPSSDRCSETCKYIPPPPLTPHKWLASTVFPTPRMSLSERPDHLLVEGGPPDPGHPSKSVDYLFAYHDDQMKCRYYWRTSPIPTNQVSPKELPSDPKIGSPVNRPEGKALCSGCGYCLATEQSINIFTLRNQYHPECFKCQHCDAQLNTENATLYHSSPHCTKCFTELSCH